MNEKANNWLIQAENDKEFAELALKEKFFSQCCFLSQQAAEKAMKALAFFRGADLVKSHSVRYIAQDLNFNGEIEEAAKILDTYYISARYPDALPHGAPFQAFTLTQAKQAIELISLILRKVSNEIRK